MNLQPDRTLPGHQRPGPNGGSEMDPNQQLQAVMLDLVCSLDAGEPLSEDNERFIQTVIDQSKKPRQEVIELFLETMRTKFAALKGVRPEQIVFTRAGGKPGFAIIVPEHSKD